MIELPRACFVANRIAEHADFFSFGTNDLTQTALGFSRDDVESKFVARLHGARRSSTARRSRRSTSRASAGSCGSPRGSGARRKPELKLGICGEHGGDPESIEFFHMAGLDYVSCSPYRVPIARVAAAAQAAMRGASDVAGLAFLGPDTDAYVDARCSTTSVSSPMRPASTSPSGSSTATRISRTTSTGCSRRA